MTTFFVLYDSACTACRRARSWLALQPAYVRLRFVATATTAARRLYRGKPVPHFMVIGPRGAVYRGDKAWLMCLWALKDYRSYALKLGSPALLPSASRLIQTLARCRRR